MSYVLDDQNEIKTPIMDPQEAETLDINAVINSQLRDLAHYRTQYEKLVEKNGVLKAMAKEQEEENNLQKV